MGPSGLDVRAIFPGRPTLESGIYVQRRCGDWRVDEARWSHVCSARLRSLLRMGVCI